jgi:TonB family protein
MKKLILTPLFFLLILTGFSQDLSYSVQGKYAHPIKKEKLNSASIIGDIIPDFPVNWVMSYVSVEILATTDGKTNTALSGNDTLSKEQKNILQSTDLGTEIVINIKYKSKDNFTGTIETNKMHYSTTIVPETEAEYSGGYPKMAQYLKENAIDKISESTAVQIKQAVVGFTVTDKGEIANAEISKTTGDPEADQLLLDAITNMPKWKPAVDSKGKTVPQEFEFSVGNEGC